MGRQRIEHKRVVGIGGMREFDLDGLFFGLRGCLCTGHGLIQFLLTAKLRGSRLSNSPSRSFGFSEESLPLGKALVRNGKERTFATLGLAWRLARLISAGQSLAQPRFTDNRYRRIVKVLEGCIVPSKEGAWREVRRRPVGVANRHPVSAVSCSGPVRLGPSQAF